MSTGPITDDRGYNQVYGPSKAMTLRTSRRCDAILAEIGDRPASVMELGCGTGELAHLIATRTGCRVTGVDRCRPFLDKARAAYRRDNLAYRELDLGAGAWSGESFDFIVGNGILHHLYPRLDESLAQIRRLLKPGGKALFWEPNLANPYVYLLFSVPRFRRAAKLDPEEMAFRARYARTRFLGAGFRSVSVECRDFLVPNTPDALVGTVVRVGAVLERIPGLRALSQSLFIRADA